MLLDVEQVLQHAGEQIRQERKRNMLSQQDLAEIIGISDRTLRDIENGKPGPSIGSFISALRVLGLELSIQ